jgi:hydrogenase nickel incorporation protein HypA/HybF
MHELSLANNIIDQVCEAALQNGAEKVVSVRVMIGPLAGIEPDSLDFCFTAACNGTIAEGALLVMEKSPLLIKCLRCLNENETGVHDLVCSLCQCREVLVLTGKEFKIIDLEVI